MRTIYVNQIKTFQMTGGDEARQSVTRILFNFCELNSPCGLRKREPGITIKAVLYLRHYRFGGSARLVFYAPLPGVYTCDGNAILNETGAFLYQITSRTPLERANFQGSRWFQARKYPILGRNEARKPILREFIAIGTAMLRRIRH
jgi:hypothetical protein